MGKWGESLLSGEIPPQLQTAPACPQSLEGFPYRQQPAGLTLLGRAQRLEVGRVLSFYILNALVPEISVV